MCQRTCCSPKSLSGLIDALLHHLVNLRYSQITICHYRRVFQRFVKFQLDHGKTRNQLVKNDVTRYLLSRGISPEGPHQIDRTGMRMLLEFQKNGCFVRRQFKLPSTIRPCYENILDQYLMFRVNETNIAPSTKRRFQDVLRNFFEYLTKRNIKTLKDLQIEHVHQYFKTCSSCAPCTLSLVAGILRGLFRHLVSLERLPIKFIASIPHIRYANNTRLTDVWPKIYVENVIAIIDRQSPMGKRDYAICLLVARLGLRASDVRRLQIDNINWRKGVITISQQKTKAPLELPFTEEIGTALIDYLKHGRPNSTQRVVFLRHCAPFEPFGAHNSLHEIISKYREKAEIVLPRECRSGFHSLRHSLATRLHEADTPLPVLATILGHTSVESTRNYARTNIEMLRSAALGWKETDHE